MVIWETIDGYPNYKVNAYGEVLSVRRNIILKPYLDAWGYLVVDLFNERGRSPKRVHRLVSKTFIPNPYNKPEVNHIDGNKRNNSVDNLEWVTRSENELHAFATGLNVRSSYDAGRPKRRIRVLETGQVFNSVRECADVLGCTHTNIVNYFKRNGITCAGYHLELLN